MIVIKGIAASPGIAIGRAYVVEDEDIVVERVEIPRDRIKEEVRRFKIAQKATHRDLDAAEIKVLKVLGKHHAKLIDAHRLILKDSLITHDVPKRIQKEGVNAEFALSEALEQVNRQFERMEDEFFRERRHDLFDVGKRLLLHLMKRQKRTLADIDEECILIARNLLPFRHDGPQGDEDHRLCHRPRRQDQPHRDPGPEPRDPRRRRALRRQPPRQDRRPGHPRRRAGTRHHQPGSRDRRKIREGPAAGRR